MNSTDTSSTNICPAYLMFEGQLRFLGGFHLNFREIVINENFIADITPRLLVLEETLRESKETLNMQTRRDVLFQGTIQMIQSGMCYKAENIWIQSFHAKNILFI